MECLFIISYSNEDVISSHKGMRESELQITTNSTSVQTFPTHLVFETDKQIIWGESA